MKIKRRQTIGNIQFIVESHFKNTNAPTVSEMHSKIMIKEVNKNLNEIEKNETNLSRTINKI